MALPSDEQMPRNGLIRRAALAGAGEPTTQMPEPPEAPEAEDAAEPNEPPEGTAPDMQEDASEGEAPDEGGESDNVVEAARSQVEAHIPPEIRAPVERLVLAGKKLMYDPKSHQLMMEKLQQQGKELTESLPIGIAALMSILMAKAKGAMPMPAVVPASLLLMFDAADFLEQAGQLKVTPDSLATMTEDLSAYIMQKLNIGPREIQAARQAFAQRAQGGGQQPPEGGPPQAAAGPEGAPLPGQGAPMPAGGGMIQRAMVRG